MANLRGGNFEKQIKDAFHRLVKFREGRHMKNDNFTHSLAVARKREMYLKDFKQYLENKNIKEGKINQFMNKKNLNEFVQERIKDLAPKTQMDYISGFNSMINGLRDANVTIPHKEKDIFKDIREKIKIDLKQQEYVKGREIKDISSKINKLSDLREESAIIAKLQAETGLRVSEALEVAKNVNKYYDRETNSLIGIKGKGNHLYQPKQISKELLKELQKIEYVPSYSTYTKDLKSVGINKSHDFRVTYAKQSYINKKENGMNEKEALKEVSKEINHHRPSMTEYYLARS
jgi:integrase